MSLNVEPLVNLSVPEETVIVAAEYGAASFSFTQPEPETARVFSAVVHSAVSPISSDELTVSSSSVTGEVPSNVTV